MLTKNSGTDYDTIWAAATGPYVLKAGDTMTGALNMVDANFSLSQVSSAPTLTFDSGDYLQYNRSTNNLYLFIGGAAVGTFSAVPSGGSFQAKTLYTDANFNMSMASGTPVLTFDVAASLSYNRTSSAYGWTIGGNQAAALTATRFTLGPTANSFYLDWANSQYSSLFFDVGDYLQYDRTNNQAYFTIGSTNYLTISTTSLSYYGSALYINPNTATNSLLGLLKPSATNGTSCAINGYIGSNLRWSMQFPNTGNETGSNVGSDFALYAYGDTGAYLGQYMAIIRQTGIAYFTGANVQIQPAGTGDAALYLNKGAAGRNNLIWGLTNGSNRWVIINGDNGAESGSNAGSDWGVNSYSDAGAYLTTPLKIVRSNGQVLCQGSGGLSVPNGNIVTAGSLQVSGSALISSSVTGQGYAVTGSYIGGSRYNITQLGCNTAGTTAIALYNGTASSATWTITPSDRRLKSNLKPAGDALDVVNRLPVYDLDFTPSGAPAEGFPAHQTERWPFSLIADEIAEVLPHAAVSMSEEDGDHWVAFSPQHLCAVLWRAVQQLSARVEALEGKA